ncbi:MAG: L-fucose:H+ symporter permease [Bacteroidaceae bacterium]|nr:L-fucose:H+ symporter permease [Bacteroidaceae bacterium]
MNNKPSDSGTQSYLVPFILITSLFFFWGVANNMTDTLLSAFKRIMSMSDTQTSLIQFAFYGSYFCFALPAALFIRKYSYKAGVLLGLVLYAGGAMLFYPAAQAASYTFYLVAIYILAGGCSILETTANPYILAMGSPERATYRLNVAQAFNPLGSISGILLSQYFILSELNTANEQVRAAMSEQELAAMQQGELNAVTYTYMGVGAVLLVVLLIMCIYKMPAEKKVSDDKDLSLGASFSRLLANKRYSFGVLAQFFYVGAQIGVWSYTIRLVMQELNIVEKDAATYYLLSIVCFSLSRFVFTFLMRYVRPSFLLALASIAALLCSVLVTATQGSGMTTVVLLVGISVFMSLMFPTIYGIALEDVGDDAKIAASGLIMAILGGALLTPLQGIVSDNSTIGTAYLIPAFCFVVVLAFAIYAMKTEKTQKK